MTKKILLKWLEKQEAKALAEVLKQRDQAQAQLRDWKCTETKFDELVAEIEPMLNAVYDRVQAWHNENEAICGRASMQYGSISRTLYPLVCGHQSLADTIRGAEFSDTKKDAELMDKFGNMYRDVEGTYEKVIAVVNSLANANLGMEYLEGLGFDLTGLKTDEEKPVETALATPIDTRFLRLKKEDSNGSTDI
jgi:hypothetical protein